ncbi:MAG: transposase [Rubrivivax sp.]|nr:transposase [Rubrivivax sp.]
MARLPRLEWPGQLHFLVQRGHGALAGPGVFTDAADRSGFVTALREGAAAEPVQVHAYALLHDEAQLLVTPLEAGALGRLMQAVGRRYVSAYNRRHQHRGSLWAGRYHCAVLEAGELRLAALRLVDGAGAEPGATSAGSRTGAPRETWLVDPPEVWALGNTPFEREAAYRSLLARGLDAEQAHKLRQAALGGWALGEAAFLAAAARATARPAQPRPRGRPRKPA